MENIIINENGYWTADDKAIKYADNHDFKYSIDESARAVLSHADYLRYMYISECCCYLSRICDLQRATRDNEQVNNALKTLSANHAYMFNKLIVCAIAKFRY